MQWLLEMCGRIQIWFLHKTDIYMKKGDSKLKKVKECVGVMIVTTGIGICLGCGFAMGMFAFVAMYLK